MLALMLSGKLVPQKLLGRTISLEQSIEALTTEALTTMDRSNVPGVTIITDF